MYNEERPHVDATWKNFKQFCRPVSAADDWIMSEHDEF